MKLTIHTSIEDLLGFAAILLTALALWGLRKWAAGLWLAGWLFYWSARRTVRLERTEESTS